MFGGFNPLAVFPFDCPRFCAKPQKQALNDIRCLHFLGHAFLAIEILLLLPAVLSEFLLLLSAVPHHRICMLLREESRVDMREVCSMSSFNSSSVAIHTHQGLSFPDPPLPTRCLLAGVPGKRNFEEALRQTQVLHLPSPLLLALILNSSRATKRHTINLSSGWNCFSEAHMNQT